LPSAGLAKRSNFVAGAWDRVGEKNLKKFSSLDKMCGKLRTLPCPKTTPKENEGTGQVIPHWEAPPKRPDFFFEVCAQGEEEAKTFLDFFFKPQAP
jgi:hypothetical protein